MARWWSSRHRSEAQKKKRETYYLEQGQIGVSDVIEMDRRIDPRQIPLQAIVLGVDNLQLFQTGNAVHVKFNQSGPGGANETYCGCKSFAVLVQTLVELAAEELDAQNGEDQPEDQTDEQHVEDGRNGEHERVDYDLQRKEIRPETTVGSREETKKQEKEN